MESNSTSAALSKLLIDKLERDYHCHVDFFNQAARYLARGRMRRKELI